MASRYMRRFQVQNEFNKILSDFSKAIVRNRPKDIIDFAIEYFKSLESQIKSDYKYKSENSSDVYHNNENQRPNIITAPNTLDISPEDKNRYQRSMEKIDIINNSHEYTRETNIKNDEKIVPRKIIRYNTWFDYDNEGNIIPFNDQNDKQNEKIDIPKNSGYNETKVVKRNNEGNYEDWFSRHSGNRLLIDNKQKLTKIELNFERYQGDYQTWFENHCQRMDYKY